MAELRIGDSERGAAVERLQQFHAEGRLTDEELEERVAVALAAKTNSDLAPLFTDLPGGATGALSSRPSSWLAPSDPATAVAPSAPVQGYSPVPYEPMRQPPQRTAWYAQWWVILLPIALTVINEKFWVGIVLASLWIWVIYPALHRPTLSAPEPPPRQLTPEERFIIRKELLAGRKIGAIKVYRELTGAGLRTAKEAVDAMALEFGG